MITFKPRHLAAVRDWWEALSDEQRAEFFAVASLTPERISNPVAPAEAIEADDAYEWYDYLVNQDVRFYFDRSSPRGTYHILDPIIAPISSAADIQFVSHLLTRGDSDV